MKKNYFISLFLLFLTVGTASAATMSGQTYSIISSVIGGGGGPMVSEFGAYQMNGTIGQSSPLMVASAPALGTTYELRPGFWNTVGGCPFDLQGNDGDVDGADLAAYAAAGDFTSLATFATAFGTGCQ